MTHADDLRSIVERLVRELLPMQEFNVAAVQTTTVTLSFGDGGQIEDVPCASTYGHRRVGDRVIVVRFPGGNWSVLGRSQSVDPTP